MLETLQGKGLLPRWLAWMRKAGERDIDVARFKQLSDRVPRADRGWLEIMRDLMVVDESNTIKFLVLTEVMRDR